MTSGNFPFTLKGKLTQWLTITLLIWLPHCCENNSLLPFSKNALSNFQTLHQNTDVWILCGHIDIDTKNYYSNEETKKPCLSLYSDCVGFNKGRHCIVTNRGVKVNDSFLKGSFTFTMINACINSLLFLQNRSTWQDFCIKYRELMISF